jgi:mono/diheme cytochrome c family protein
MKKLLLPVAVTLAVASLAAYQPSGLDAKGVRSLLASTVWDSVYTDSQAVRGDSVYQAKCVKCHGPGLEGTADGNPLTGADFKGNWDGQTLDKLFDLIRNEMPSDDPKTIPAEFVPDLMAFVLKHNGMPAGASPLVNDAAKLKEIKFTKAKP